MIEFPEGNAIVYCQGNFNTTNGKTAHGLVRKTARYRVLSVVDTRYAGQDAGMVLDGLVKNIPVYPDIQVAFDAARLAKTPATHLVVGLAPDGGRLNPSAREDVKQAIRMGLNVDCGLHDFLTEDPEIADLARENNVLLRDIRKTPSRANLHFFSGKIEEVNCLKVAVLGTDSAIGKRTTAWILVDAIRKAGMKTEIIGTGQTAWLQGARYSIILDSLINDFVAGEIEHAVWSAWKDEDPNMIFIEGQGSLMNPAYPGGFEILAAGRPEVVVLQHAPARKEYDGFPGYPLHPLDQQIRVIELLSGKRVIAITINHENLKPPEIDQVCQKISRDTGLVCCDPLVHGVDSVVKELKKLVIEKINLAKDY
jgi:uncharacterized NAD-dependent epimerase/dehydratase family protein